MAGYLGPKAIQYNVDNSVVQGDSSVGGDLTVNGNVGIGTDSPSTSLQVKHDGGGSNSWTNAGSTAMFSETNASNPASIKLNASTVANGSQIVWGGLAGDGPFVFRNYNAERMRIDSDGKLLVGKTNLGVSRVGAEMRDGVSDYAVTGTSSSSPAAVFNRTESDGEILRFRKDNVAVGSIGSEGSSGTFYVGSGDVTLAFNDASDMIFPRGTNAANRTGVIDLGNANNRFKDLYLSGGVYLGGAAAANKLDDYEEGTFVASILSSGGGVSLNPDARTLTYTKVGRLVSVSGVIGISATSGTGTMKITLPFVSGIDGTTGATANVNFNGISGGSINDFWSVVPNNVNYLQVYLGTGASANSSSSARMQAGTNMRVSVVYQTDE